MFSARNFVQIFTMIFVTDRTSILIIVMMMMIVVVVTAMVVFVAGMDGRALTMEAVKLWRFGRPSCGQ